MIVFLLVNIVMFNLKGLEDLDRSRHARQVPSSAARPPSWPGEVAEALQHQGVHAGDKVGVIGYAFDAFWARLARVHIVAEMLEQDALPFWLGAPSKQAEMIQAFARTGARAIVAEAVPDYAALHGWHRVGNSNYYILSWLPDHP
jgi:hypothetical protein